MSKLDRFGAVAVTGFGLVAGIGVLAGIPLLVMTLIASGFGALSITLIVAFFVLGLSLLAYVILNELRGKTPSTHKIRRAEVSAAADTLKLADTQRFIEAPSAVENSTELLPIRPTSGELR